ncbi:MAG: hypothetical protein V7K55_16195 [Nostoc sp.]
MFNLYYRSAITKQSDLRGAIFSISHSIAQCKSFWEAIAILVEKAFAQIL